MPEPYVQHYLTEFGTTNCPVEAVRANVDEGECSACGALVARFCPGCNDWLDDEDYKPDARPCVMCEKGSSS